VARGIAHTAEPQSPPRRTVPVRAYILLVVLAAVLPVTLLAAILAEGYVRAETERFERRVRAAVLDASALIERDLAGITATLQSLATSHALRAGDLRAFHEQAMQVKALTGLDLFLRDREGRQVLNTRVPFGTPLPDRSALAAWDAEVLETGRPVVSGHLAGGAGEHGFGVVVPVFRNGVIAHFLHTILPAARLRDLLARADLAEGWTLAVVDRDGTVLARFPDHEAAAGTPASIPDLLQVLRDGEAMEATEYVVDRDGRAVFAAARRSPVSGWALIGTASVERLLAPLRRTLRLAGIAGAALVALALFGAWLLGDRLARAIRALAALGAAVEAGASVRPPRTGIREVNEVGEALANASARLVARAAEREEAAERQRLMLRELNHRVRNTLATVDSVARLTARHASDVAEYEARLTDRIRSLAKTHELLTGANWTQAGLVELLRNEFAAYGQDDGQFRLDGPPVTLPARQAVAVGMLLHELATNAAKYGALSVPEGRVEVRWTLREGPGGARRLDLAWEETGGPPVRPPTRRGFGTQLIERAIARDLGAEVVADYAPGGLRFRLSMPLSEPSDPDDGPPGAQEASAAPAAG
jgi:two-component sensor histidine kinase